MARVEIPTIVRGVSGRALEGVDVYVYERGTTDEVDVYAATAGGSPLTQPLSTDDRGQVDGYVAPGSWDVVAELGADEQRIEFEAVVAEEGTLADYQELAEKGQPDGYASLDGSGHVPSAQLPAIAITTPSVVASQAAQLALTAQVGDVAIRSDENKSYVHNGGSAGTMADWSLLLTPTDAVLSVNGDTGVVVLDKSDVGLGNVTNDAQLKAADLDTDGTLAANSDAKLASQKAAKTYADGKLAKTTDLLGTYFGPNGIPAAGPTSGSSGVTDRTRAVGIVIPQKTTVTGIHYRVGTTADGNVRAALYDSSGTRVANRTTDLAQSAAGTSTPQRIAFDGTVVVEPGLYWALIVFSSATGTAFGWTNAGYLGPAFQGTGPGSGATPTSITPPTGQTTVAVPQLGVY